MGKLRNEDLSIYFFVVSSIGSNLKKVVDSYPYNEIESNILELPCASVEHVMTSDRQGELGANWFVREWSINIFAKTDTQRDELGDAMFRALDNAIPVRDFSVGNWIKDTGKTILGADLRLIEYINVSDREMTPVYTWAMGARPSYWRVNIAFSTTSTQVF